MAHFARLDDNNIVTMVTVISNDDMIDENGDEAEALGIAVCEKVIGPGPWVQTSYNGNFRKRYANTGHIYNAEHDAFVEQSPYPSWVLNDQHDWEAPVPKPEGEYSWNEETQTWDAIPTEELAP